MDAGLLLACMRTPHPSPLIILATKLVLAIISWFF